MAPAVIRTDMMAMTTSISTKVKARRCGIGEWVSGFMVRVGFFRCKPE
jgi:hypothetical protein